ncbi:MAG: DUF4199 domain-containing protein [Saprospiraceae bacterium]|jgi:hypothetical protein|nr:DUF4199 domain-containing protein [Saprospiraceae bacterium]
MKKPFLYGAIAGGIGILLHVIMRLIDPKLIIGSNMFLTFLVGFGVPLTLMILAGLDQRKRQNGRLPYGEALKTVFIVFVVFSLINTIYMGLFYNVFNPTFFADHKQEYLDIQREGAVKGMRWTGASESDILEMQDKLDLESQYDRLVNMSTSFGGLALSFFMGTMMGLLLSLLAALVVKRNPPSIKAD